MLWTARSLLFSLMLAAAPVQQAVDDFNASIDLYRQGNISEAGAKLEQALKADSNFPQAHYNLATVLIKQRKYNEALYHLEQAMKLKPDYRPAWHQKAALLEIIPDFKAAAAAWTAYVQKYPTDPEAPALRERIKLLERQAASGGDQSFSSNDYLAHISRDGIARWPKDKMPLKVYIKNGSTVPHYRPEFKGILEQSFAAWAAGSDNQVSFVYVNAPSGADIECSWTADPGKLNTLAEGGHAQVDVVGSNIALSRLVLLTSLSGKDVTDNSMRGVCLHEIGHAIGLDHSLNPADIMFVASHDIDRQSDPTQRDLNTLSLLYKQDDAFMKQHRIATPQSEPGIAGSQSTVGKASRLNNEGVAATERGEFDLAESKFNEALKLQPGDRMTTRNLGILWTDRAGSAGRGGKLTEADYCMKMAIKYLEESKSTDVLKNTLPDYARLLRILKRTAEADAMEARAAKL